MSECKISDMVGKTFDVVCGKEGEKVLEFRVEKDGSGFRFYHAQDCCEDVHVAEIVGDIGDLEGAPLLQAEEVSSDDAAAPSDDFYRESYTWTFYKFATVKGSVTVRWLGASNGYYSERVDLARLGHGAGMSELKCLGCEKPATWMRRTQFAGDHPYCEEHARLEDDFGKDDSDCFFWTSIIEVKE